MSLFDIPEPEYPILKKSEETTAAAHTRQKAGPKPLPKDLPRVIEGKLEGLKGAIELGVTLKFPGDIDTVMARVNKTDDLDLLVKIKEAIKTAGHISEILALI